MFYNSLPFDDKAAEEYGVIRADLSQQGKLIGPNDLMIASIAKAYDLVLVTNNIKEFYFIIYIFNIHFLLYFYP